MIPLRDDIPSYRFPIVMWIIIALNVVIFMGELSCRPEDLERVFHVLGIVPATLPTRPGIWRYLPFFSSMFLHGGWFHLIGNMWMLWIFGDNVEDRMGHFRFFIFYLLCGLAAGYVHCWSNANSMIPTIGASGAIAGVLGAYFVFFPWARVITLVPLFFWPFFIEIPAVIYLILWFVQQLFGSMVAALLPNVGGIAWTAHVGGFVAGMFLCYLFRAPQRRRRAIYRGYYPYTETW
ncbi:MAG: rhomboid family intramembrane serine protease [Lentisphaerae bacterium]|nr:MAG: rhomboid family intramembrane serine protease [Lentisphaerota bacterium]